jgi:hypothetical protein
MRLKLVAISVLLILISVPYPLPAAQRTLEESRTFPAGDGKRLIVQAFDLDISVQLADVDHIEAEISLHIANTSRDAAERWIENHTPHFDDSEEVLLVSVEPEKSTGFLGFGRLSASARLTLRVPGTIVPDLTTSNGAIRIRGDFPNAEPLRLRSLSGDITMFGAAGSVHVHGGDGDVDISVIRPLGEFFARTSAGDIRIVGGAQRARVDTGSGKIWLQSMSGGVEASTSNGRITLGWDRLDPQSHVRVRSASGRIQLEVPAAARPQGRLTTTTGNIRSEFAGRVTADGSTLELEGDGATFDVETASGAIQLVVAEGWN